MKLLKKFQIQFICANLYGLSILLSQCDKSFTINKRIRYELAAVTDSMSNTKYYDTSDLFVGDKCSIYTEPFEDEEQLADYFNNNKYISFFILKDKEKHWVANHRSILWGSKIRNLDENLSFHWTIHDEQKIINNLVCKKATIHFRGRNWTAWFSEEIPISDGPYKFYGLPGLIIELYDGKDHYHYKLKDIKEFEPIALHYTPKHEVVNKKEFLLRIEDNGTTDFKNSGKLKVTQRINGGEEEDITPKPIKLKNLIELTDENGKRIVLK